MPRLTPLALRVAAVALPLLLAACAHGSLRARPVRSSAIDGDVYRAGRITFAGQPDEAALRALAQSGTRVVINLRPREEMLDVPFDEPALVNELGMRYFSLPFTPATFDVATVARFAAALEGEDGAILLHCSSGNRAGGLWAAYLALHREKPLEEALELGRSAGLRRESMEEAVGRVVERRR